MSENEAKTEKPKEKKPIQILRDRRGGVPKERMENHRERTKIRKRITEALEDGPKTVPEIAKITGLPNHEVMWYVMGMKKYGEVAEGEERDEYYEYVLLKEENK